MSPSVLAPSCQTPPNLSFLSTHNDFGADCSSQSHDASFRPLRGCWSEEELDSAEEWATVFWSLAATVKFRPAFDDTLEAKAVQFLKAVQIITSATMEMLITQLSRCSARVLYHLVKADLIPQLIATLNPQTLSFAKAVDIHTYLLKTIAESFNLATPIFLAKLEITDHDKQQAVHETYLPTMDFVLHMPVILTIPS
ncbi:hypothetical protein BLNAU_1024 [Blattamonas nauphoetae]|uniref:Uncharacterized protein n=1 Tax=Blattamonas nauphoetae TaxID=2049346 RepID=A0ABQ9YJK5_9EUKA|nr:hypothetical protein BLNAU_1024 [Blattamonas nauphoetae]